MGLPWGQNLLLMRPCWSFSNDPSYNGIQVGPHALLMFLFVLHLCGNTRPDFSTLGWENILNPKCSYITNVREKIWFLILRSVQTYLTKTMDYLHSSTSSSHSGKNDTWTSQMSKETGQWNILNETVMVIQIYDNINKSLLLINFFSIFEIIPHRKFMKQD